MWNSFVKSKFYDVSRMDCHDLKETVAYLKETQDLRLRFVPLDRASLKLYVFVDSGHNTNCEKTD